MGRKPLNVGAHGGFEDVQEELMSATASECAWETRLGIVKAFGCSSPRNNDGAHQVRSYPVQGHDHSNLTSCLDHSFTFAI
jgi:hypothetical protein